MRGPRSRPFVLPIVLVLSTLLASPGCVRTDLENRLADYGDAARELLGPGRDAQEESEAGLVLPSRRDRRIDLPDHRIGGFDFLAVQGCRLSQLIGHRNSPMGRVMVRSRLLIHELEVLEAAGACLEGLPQERAERFATLISAKRSELPAHVWNALWIGEELERYLSPSLRPFGGGSRPPDSGALDEVVAVARRPIRSAPDAVELEQALAGLASDFPAGATMRLLERARQELEGVAALVAPHTPIACRDDAVRMTRLFETRYLPLQRDLALLDRQAGQRIEALDVLFAASAKELEAVPAAMEAYRRRVLSLAEPDGIWQRYRRAVRRHAAAWQPTLTRCGVLPEADAT